MRYENSMVKIADDIIREQQAERKHQEPSGCSIDGAGTVFQRLSYRRRMGESDTYLYV